jgi:hypothetical protein
MHVCYAQKIGLIYTRESRARVMSMMKKRTDHSCEMGISATMVG